LSYVALTVARNEEALIEHTIQSVLSQTIPPQKYIIIDDGSTDGTPDIIKSYRDRGVTYFRVNDERHEVKSYNMCRAINIGHKLASSISPDWCFSLKVDADSVLPADYAENLLAFMNRHPNLGAISGRIRGRKAVRTRPSDGAKLYRRSCWDALGGVDYVIGFDTYATIRCNQLGFETFVSDICYDELRTSKRKSFSGWYLTGATRYYLGLPLWHTFCVGFVYLNDKPYVIGSLIMFFTHLLHTFIGRKNRFDPDYYRFARWYVLQETINRVRVLFHTTIAIISKS